MTKLDAINRMLRYIGELPVPSSVVIANLPDGHEARIADTILDETLREEQEEKWWFNTFEVEYTPQTSGYITPPNNLIEFESDENYIIEGGDFYDVDNETKIFTEPITVTARLEITFDNIPDVFRTYAVLVASKHLHVYLNGDETTQQELDKKVQLQRIKLEREHLKQSKFNLVKGTRLIDRTSNPSAVS